MFIPRLSASPSWSLSLQLLGKKFLTIFQCFSSTQNLGTMLLSSGGLSLNKPKQLDFCRALETDLERKLIQVLLIWRLLKLSLLLELLLMLELKLLPPRLLLMPELLLLPELLPQDHPNWSKLIRLVFKLAETWLASAEILLPET
jgi:hypothetical protein